MKKGDETQERIESCLDDPGSLRNKLETLEKRLLWTQESQTLVIRILTLLSRHISSTEAIHELLRMVKDFTGFEAVGIRLRDGDDFPYFETRGFPGYFVEEESSLCSRTEAGEIIRDWAGNPVLECMCGNVISGRTDPSLPFFTPGGSFWSNCTTELLASTSEKERQSRTRDRCNGEGYESVALIPLRSDNETIGLLQLNDSRKNCFTREMIEFFEGIGVSIGIVLAHRRVKDELELRVEERTAALTALNEELLSEISERRRIEEATRAEKRKFETLSEQAPFAMMLIAEDGSFEYINPKFTEVFGYGPEDVPNGREWFRLAYPDPDYRHEVIAAWIDDISTHKPGEQRPRIHVVRCKDGTDKIISFGSVQLHTGQHLVTCKDITERKRAAEALRNSEERYRAFLDATTDMAFLKDEAFRYLMVNKANQEFFGKSETEILGKTDFELMPRTGAENCRRSDLEALEREGIVVSEEEIGGRVFETKKFPVGLGNGKMGAGGLIRDITERERAEAALRASEAKLASAMAMAHLGHWEYDVKKDLFTFNDHFYKIFRTTAEQVGGYTMSSAEYARRFVHPDEMTVVGAEIRKSIESTDPQFSGELEHRIVYADGEIGHITVRYFLVKDKRGRTVKTYGVNQDITERKKAEEALRESEARLRSILATSPVGIVGLGKDRIINWANDACLEMFGYESEDEVVGRDTRTVYSSDAEYERVGRILYESIQEGKIASVDAKLRRKDGSLFDAIIRIKASDIPDVAIAAISDISDRRRAEEALRESEEKYRLVVEKAQEGILVAQDGMHRFVNPKTIEIFGRTEQELLSKPFSEFIHQDDREMVQSRNERRLRGEHLATRYSFRIVNGQGAVKWVEIDSAMISWEGKPAALVFVTDVTERLTMEAALKESEERYRTLVEESFDGMFIQKGPKILFANSRLHEMLGYAPSELEGLDHWTVYHPDYQKITRERAIARMRGEKVTSQYEVKLQRKDGSSFDGEISARAVTIKGEPGVVVWVRDISKRKRSEEAQKRLATAVEQAAEAIVITDTTGRIQYVNPAFERVSGYVRDEVLGRNPRVLKSGNLDKTFYKNLWDTIHKGEVWTGRFVNKRKDGSIYKEDSTISPVRDSNGKIVNFVAVKRDMTEHLQLSEQLLQAQKMEAVGILAGGIAHDFNNLLQVTLGYSELLLSQKEDDDPDSADLQKIFHAAKNGADLVQRLLTFSRKVEPKPRPLNLNRQVVQVEKLLRRTIPRMIAIQLDLSDNLARIHADPSQVEQVLMNLAVNARDAMPDGGKLTMRTATVTLDNEWCKIHMGPKPGEYVLLTVSDTGLGMDKATVDHIFEPFYTTKELGRGTGLGLAMVYGIVKQHNGHIMCESEIGRGTSFNVYFPAIETREELRPEETGIVPALGMETVLLVDDEEFIRELGRRILSDAGYTVLTAANGKEALEIFKREAAKISLVILDLIMPEMGGKECLKGILNVDQHAKILMASGLSAQFSIKESVEMGASGFVGKPFRIKELLGQVRKILDES